MFQILAFSIYLAVFPVLYSGFSFSLRISVSKVQSYRRIAEGSPGSRVTGFWEDVLPCISRLFRGGGGWREWGKVQGAGHPEIVPGALVRDLSETALWNRNIRLELPLAGVKA